MFCPACAAAVEPGQENCLNCGEILPVPRSLTPEQHHSNHVMPAAVRQAGILLWVSVGISLLTFAVSMIIIMNRVAPIVFAAPIVLMTVLWVLAIVFTMRRSNLARMLTLILVAYSAFNILIRFRLYIAHANPGAFISMLELALRAYAVYLLFRPESSAWFAGKAQPSGS